MKLKSITGYRRTTEMAADDMINEGGAIRQPSRKSSVQSLSHLGTASSHREFTWRQVLHDPTAMFWTGFATGLALSILDNRREV